MLPAQEARELMVDHQVRTWDVLDERVLDVLRTVPRERFVPQEHRYLAFADLDIPLPHAQHMLRPNVAGRLLQALQLTGSDRVLEIGSGTGYVTACLAAASASVRSLEIFPDLAELGRANIAELSLPNVEIESADASHLDAGSSSARYDAIALTASLPVYDERFQELLTMGGRLFAVVGSAPIMEARLIRRLAEDRWVHESLFETMLDPLINARHPAKFTF